VLSLQDVANYIKEALHAPEVKLRSPLFVLDDIQIFCEGPTVKREVTGFLTWAHHMVSLGLLNFVMVSSDRLAMEPLRLVTGFSSRMKFLEIPYLRTDELETILQSSWGLSGDDAKYVVDHLGGHIGDVFAIESALKQGISARGMSSSLCIHPPAPCARLTCVCLKSSRRRNDRLGCRLALRRLPR